jgi:hypothetical protein
MSTIYSLARTVWNPTLFFFLFRPAIYQRIGSISLIGFVKSI